MDLFSGVAARSPAGSAGLGEIATPAEGISVSGDRQVPLKEGEKEGERCPHPTPRVSKPGAQVQSRLGPEAHREPRRVWASEEQDQDALGGL